MEDQTQTVSTEQQTSDDSQTATLDDVYKQYNVEEQASNFSPQRQTQQVTQQPAQQQQPTPAIPDPVLDPNGYKNWHGQQNTMVNQALSQMSGELKSLRDERTRTREEADIKGAVTQFKKVVGPEIDDELAEVALGARARKDPKFLAVYQNRNSNPQAWNAAVSAYANEFKGKVQFKIDSQLTENVRAAKQSIQGSQSTKASPAPGDAGFFEGKTGPAFDHAWNQYISRNQY